MYAFRALADPDLALGTSRLLLPDSPLRTYMLTAGTFGHYIAHYRGALLALFGEPLTVSDVADEAYTYVIEASDVNGRRWVLTAYQGPSGPAIGGNASDPSVYPVAHALRQQIEQTLPADFDAVLYDDDTDSTIFYGSKDGVCYSWVQPGDHLPS